MKTPLLSLFLLLLVLSGCAGGGSILPAEATRQELTVVSYNIRVGVGPGASEDRGENIYAFLDPIAEWLLEQKADIVLLQEVDLNARRSGEIDQMRYLTGKLGFHGVFAPAIRISSNGRYGTALLSRWPITEHRVVPLFRPNYEETNPDFPAWYSEQRVLSVAEVETPGGKIHVLNTHLGITEDQQTRQIGQILEVVRELPAGAPVIFGGDLNALPRSPVMAPLREALRDCYEDGPERIPVAQRLTFHSRNPNRCIDYIFVSPGNVEIHGVEVPRIQLSDHLPVLARLTATWPTVASP